MSHEFDLLCDFYRHVTAIAEVVENPFCINVGHAEDLWKRHQAWKVTWNHDKNADLMKHAADWKADHVDAIQISMGAHGFGVLQTLDLSKILPLAIRILDAKKLGDTRVYETHQILSDRGYKVSLGADVIYATRKIVEHRDMTPFAPYSMTPPEYRQWEKAVENKDPEEIGRLIGIGFARQVQQMEALK